MGLDEGARANDDSAQIANAPDSVAAEVEKPQFALIQSTRDRDGGPLSDDVLVGRREFLGLMARVGVASFLTVCWGCAPCKCVADTGSGANCPTYSTCPAHCAGHNACPSYSACPTHGGNPCPAYTTCPTHCAGYNACPSYCAGYNACPTHCAGYNACPSFNNCPGFSPCGCVSNPPCSCLGHSNCTCLGYSPCTCLAT
jgi:hypothetical protein